MIQELSYIEKLEAENKKLKTAMLRILTCAIAEEGQSWRFSFVMDEAVYGKLEDLCVSDVKSNPKPDHETQVSL